MALPSSQATWDLQEDTRLRPMRQFQGEGVGGAADVVGFGRPIVQEEAVPGTHSPQITEGTSRPPLKPGRILFGFSKKQTRSVLPYTGDGKADVNTLSKTIIKRNVSGKGSLQRNCNEIPANGDFPVGLGMQGSCSGYRHIATSTACENSVRTKSNGNRDYNSREFFGAEGGNAARREVEEVLDLFHEKCKKLLSEKKKSTASDWTKTYVKAARDLKDEGRWVNAGKRLGAVPGIEIGDWFLYRAELCTVGLHHEFIRGIDYMGKNGNQLATSIVVTNRYDNRRKPSGVLVYCGEGGNPSVASRKKKLKDQKLEYGNRAMINSKEANKPVRVVLRVRSEQVKPYPFRSNHKRRSTSHVYVYDGLYLVTDWNQVRGEYGKLVFQFTLKRIDEPPTRGLSTNLKRRKSSILVYDLSQGKEKNRIRVVNTVDEKRQPPAFKYEAKTVFPKSCYRSASIGCDCDDGCSDNEDCSCKIKNGGTVSYDYKQRLVSEGSIVTECGPFCSCFVSCINRVSQRGIQFDIEVFRTESEGWGVRSRSYIPAGSFVCEYAGEIVEEKESEQRAGNGFSFRIGGGFVIDATQCGNIGRFIRKSQSPNLMAKKVLYDHYDQRMPHIMLFAREDIFSGRELTCDYSYR